MAKYRFVDTEKEHLHQIFDESLGDWQNLTGTSSVVDVLGKPLTWWASGLACQTLGWLKPEKDKKFQIVNQEEREKQAGKFLEDLKASDFTGKMYFDLLEKAYRAHYEFKNEKADEGTELHERLEMAVKLMIDGVKVLDSPEPKVMEFVKWAEANVKKFLWSEMHCFSSYHFIGGISDAGALMNDGSIALIDFKSAKEAYFSHFVQCALYSLQISENKAGYDKDGNQVFTLEKPISQYIVFPFGGKKLEPIINKNIEGLKRVAISVINLYREKGIFEK